MPAETLVPQSAYNNYTNSIREFSSIEQNNRLELKTQLRREVVGSKAFNLEYFAHTSEQEMHDDIVSYLGEYRFKLKKFDYQMVYGKGEDGKFAIRDSVRGETLAVKAERVLKERTYRGDPTHREEAEGRGITSLDAQLRFAGSGDKIFWMSPPGPKEEGYGRYGFLYEGTLAHDARGQKLLQMSAIRLESSDLEAYNGAFSKLTGSKVHHKIADAFLEAPMVVNGSSGVQTEDILQQYFQFTADLRQNSDFEGIIGRISPLIYEVIDKIKYGTQTEKIVAFNTLENYFIRQAEDLEREREAGEKVLYLDSYRKATLADLRAQFGHQAPVASGSCGSSATSGALSMLGGKGIDQFLKASSSEEYSFDKTGDCRVCGKEDVQVGPCDICQPCDASIKSKNEHKEMLDKLVMPNGLKPAA